MAVYIVCDSITAFHHVVWQIITVQVRAAKNSCYRHSTKCFSRLL